MESKEQLQAISHKDGPMLVLAGPGSGKTYVLTRHIRHLITAHSIPPDQILVITFTKAAALEMYKNLTGKTVSVKVKCFESKMYGSVTAQDVANALADIGFTVDKKKITIPAAIKTLGLYDVDVWCYKETVAKIKIDVVAE